MLIQHLKKLALGVPILLVLWAVLWLMTLLPFWVLAVPLFAFMAYCLGNLSCIWLERPTPSGEE